MGLQRQCRRYGGGGGAGEPCPPTKRLLVPHFGLLKQLHLEHHSKTRQQTMMEKGIINYFQTQFSFDVLSILCEIAGNQLLCHISLTQYSVLLTRLYGCVAEETSKPAEPLPALR